MDSNPVRAVSVTRPNRWPPGAKAQHKMPVHRRRAITQPRAPLSQPGGDYPPRKSALTARPPWTVQVAPGNAEWDQRGQADISLRDPPAGFP